MSFYFINDDVMVREDMIAKVELTQRDALPEGATRTMHSEAPRHIHTLVFSAHSGEELGTRDCEGEGVARQTMRELASRTSIPSLLLDQVQDLRKILENEIGAHIPENSKTGMAFDALTDMLSLLARNE